MRIAIDIPDEQIEKSLKESEYIHEDEGVKGAVGIEMLYTNGKIEFVDIVRREDFYSCSFMTFRDDGPVELESEHLRDATKMTRETTAGTWIDKKITIKKAHGIAYSRWSCSVCKTKQPHKSNFCQNCGADMREEKITK